MTPTDTAGLRVTVVVAATDTRPSTQACLAAFTREVAGRGEVVLVDASGEGIPDVATPPCRVLRRPHGALAPELWRDGLDACDTPLVALTTSAMVPAPGWLDALHARLEATGAAVVGGPIEAAGILGRLDRAAYLLRYARYGLPWQRPDGLEPPGDNALYRRDCLLCFDSLWADGFREVEIHRALRQRGETLALAERATVVYQGGETRGSFPMRRFRHALRYAADRAVSMNLAARLARTAAAPAVPLVLLGRIVAALRARGRSPLSALPALPDLALSLAAWTAGEVFGTWFGPPARRVPDANILPQVSKG